MKKKKGFAALLIMLAALAFSVIGFILVFDVPHWQRLDPDRLHALKQTSVVYDRDSALISELRGSENRILVSLDSVPLHTRNAFLAAEDMRFYSHPGIDVYRILGAIKNNLISGSLGEGASTITQQLAKLTHLSPDKTIRRKLEEISLAFQIEAAYSKDEILEMYLNTVYFGRGAYGIRAAAQEYFNIEVRELTVAQSACLAAIIKAPSIYAPHISPEKNRERRSYILRTMHEHGYISEAEFEEAEKERIWVRADGDDPQVYSWYIDEVIRECQSILSIGADDVITGGYQIHTAFDPSLQSIADDLYLDNSFFPSNAADGTPIQSAMAVVDTGSGAVRAMIGGRDYSVKRGLNRATQMRRQPGSSLKPLSVYGPALEAGYTAASVLLDEKTSFDGYTPQNAGDRYYGRVTMRTALRNSLNTTAVRLLDEIGIERSIVYLNKMGIPTQESDRNLSLALGSMTYGVTPVELAAAYVPFANGGLYHEPFCVSRILSPDGEIIFEREEEAQRVISSQDAYLMTSMLQSVVSNGTGTKLLSSGTPVAGKTGTVSMAGGNRDIWMAAYTPELSVSVWMGFDQTDSAHKIPNGVTGGRNTASLAAAFFKAAYKNRDKPEFKEPEGLVWLTIDKQAIAASGSVMLASKTTPKAYRISEVFKSSNRPYAVSDVWNAPPAPSSFYISHAAGGYPQLNFRAAAYARYRIQRDTVGESIILTEMIGSSGENLTYNDYSAQPGVLYTYRVIPIHEELLNQGVWLEGKQAVALAQVADSGSSGFFAGLRGLIPALSVSGE